MPEDAAPVVVCRCGRRLNVRGAQPGRVGQCPSCGSTFRVPEAGLPVAAPSRTPTRPKPRIRADDDDGPPGGYDLRPSDKPEERPSSLVKAPPPPPANPERLGDPKKPRKPIEAVGRGGIMPLPKTPEKSPFGSLLYPIWDGYALAWLVVLPPILTVASLVVFGLIPIVMQGGVMALFGPVAFATIGAFVIFLAYTLVVLQSALLTSAQGNVHHPGWPDAELGNMAISVFHWAIALGVGLGPSLYAARQYLGEIPEAGPDLNRLIGATGIAALGGIYSLVALIAVCLHEDARAANPLIVLPALFRLGLAYLAPVVFWFGSVEAVTLAVRAIYRVNGFGSLVLTTWGVWVGSLYAAIVLMRLLGRAYWLRGADRLVSRKTSAEESTDGPGAEGADPGSLNGDRATFAQPGTTPHSPPGWPIQA